VISLEMTQRVLGTASVRAVREVAEALVMGDIARGLHVINAAVDSGSDPRQFGQQVVEHLRAVLLAQTSSADLVEASSEDRTLFAEQAGMIDRGGLLYAVRAFNEAVNEYRGGWQPQLSLELALIDSIRGPEPEVIQYVTQSAPPGAAGTGQQEEADAPVLERAEQTAPGTPPVIEVSVLRGKWTEMLRALYRYSRTGPDVVEKFRVQRVDGNLIYLVTDNKLYLERLQHPEKLAVLERAFYDVHRIGVRVQLALVDHLDAADDPVKASSVDADDPLISTALELGGKLKEDDEPENA
jgi:hypothetical protein